MIHETLERNDRGRFVIPCCGVELRGNVNFPVRCNCGRGILKLIDRCQHRGDPTGEMVPCGCASMPDQPVFFCRLHGTAVRHKTEITAFDGVACIACSYIRELAAGGSTDEA